jgi:hypothetical protein
MFRFAAWSLPHTLPHVACGPQRQFIPGNIGGGGLVSAADVGGPLMRDVKNFICRRLDMEGARRR